MAISIDQYAKSTSSSGNSHTFSFTVNTQSNQILILKISASGDPSVTDEGVTWNGTALTKAVETTTQIDYGSNYLHESIYYILNPEVGTHNIVVGKTQYWSVIFAVAVTIYNAEQQAPEATGSGQDDSGTTLTSTLTTITNNAFIFSGVTIRIGRTASVAGSLTLIDGDSNAPAGYQIKTTAGSISSSWTPSESAAYVTCSAAFKEYSTATGWSHKINKINNANIGKINKISKSNILKVNKV